MKISTKVTTNFIIGLFFIAIYFLIPIPDFSTLNHVAGIVIDIENKEAVNIDLSVKLYNGDVRLYKIRHSQSHIETKIHTLIGKPVEIWFSNEYELSNDTIEVWHLTHDKVVILDYHNIVAESDMVRKIILMGGVFFMFFSLVHLMLQYWN